MMIPRAFLWVVTGFAAVASSTTLTAGVIDVPNGSFEEPFVDMVSPYATSEVGVWQKASVPDWWLGLGYSAQQWSESVGTFVNVPFAPIDNVDGRQAVFMFATPGVELAQDLAAKFDVGQSYRLAVGIQGGGSGMKLGVPMEIRLYYRDDSGQRVTLDQSVATNTNTTGTITHLLEYQLDIPAVTAGDAWVGKNIGIQLISTVGMNDAGGYWDIDNVRLTAVPEPASLILLVLGTMGVCRRPRN